MSGGTNAAILGRAVRHEIESGPKILALALLAWLIPGLGHLLAGRWRRAMVFCVIIGGSFAVGLHLSNLEAVSKDLHPYAVWAESGVGAPALLLLYLDPARDRVLEAEDTTRFYHQVPPHTDTGVLFCCIAGLLNYLVLLDLVERLLGGPLARARKG